MKVGVLGLGLIGGSVARAYAKAGHSVYAWDTDASILEFAQLCGAVEGVLDKTALQSCDLVFLAIYPDGCVQWLQENAASVSKTALVMDCCGVKAQLCPACFALAREYGFTFVGGHPMAGSHNSGFKYSRSNLFQGAPMVLVPPRFDDIALLQRVKDALAPCKFGSFSVTTAQEHDRLIAFTSQMPHIISNAFIKSPTALTHKGFSAGSYKDLTRVAWLNPAMWTELFLENKDNLLTEMNTLLTALTAYRDALQADDRQMLMQLLEEGKKRKEEVDG